MMKKVFSYTAKYNVDEQIFFKVQATVLMV